MIKTMTSCFLLFCFATIAYTRPLPDSVKAKYKAAKTDEEKGRLLFTDFVRPSAADSNAITHAVELLTWFKKHQDEVGADYIELYLAAVFSFKGDYSTTLSMALPILSQFEKRIDAYGMMQANNAIGIAPGSCMIPMPHRMVSIPSFCNSSTITAAVSSTSLLLCIAIVLARTRSSDNSTICAKKEALFHTLRRPCSSHPVRYISQRLQLC